jgi:imidazolonepropionase-like amidohydrolase
LASAGISITPTLQVSRDMSELSPPGPERDMWQRRHEVLVGHVARLHRAGVRLTAGSDAGWRLTGFDTYWRELDQMGACGLSPVEVIHAATGAAAEVMGRQDDFGTLRPGTSADLLLIDGDAARDLRLLARVRSVYLEGRLVAA